MRMSRPFVNVLGVLVAGSLLGSLVGPASVSAANPRAIPAVFVGKAGDCGTNYPAGSNIVTAAWLRGMGLPDNGGLNSNAGNPTDNPNKQDPHIGLLLNKNGPTPDCSAAGAQITGVRGMTVTQTFALGFDYRNGGHCGAGAPRFNVVVQPPSGPETFHFVGGCANDAAPTPAPQDPTEWTRVRFQTAASANEAFPPIPPGSTIKSISLIFDEGTDTPSVSDPNGVGLAVLDNIYINGQYIRSGSGIAPPGGDDGDHNDDD